MVVGCMALGARGVEGWVGVFVYKRLFCIQSYKPWGLTMVSKISDIQIQIRNRFGMANSIDKYEWLIFFPQQMDFQTCNLYLNIMHLL